MSSIAEPADAPVESYAGGEGPLPFPPIVASRTAWSCIKGSDAIEPTPLMSRDTGQREIREPHCSSAPDNRKLAHRMPDLPALPVSQRTPGGNG